MDEEAMRAGTRNRSDAALDILFRKLSPVSPRFEFDEACRIICALAPQMRSEFQNFP
jgi:hypothetical protein